MTRLTSPRRLHQPPDNHIEIISAALVDFNVNPYRILWHYLWAAFKHYDGNISLTGERLSLPRRTVQRKLLERWK